MVRICVGDSRDYTVSPPVSLDSIFMNSTNNQNHTHTPYIYSHTLTHSQAYTHSHTTQTLIHTDRYSHTHTHTLVFAQSMCWLLSCLYSLNKRQDNDFRSICTRLEIIQHLVNEDVQEDVYKLGINNLTFCILHLNIGNFGVMRDRWWVNLEPVPHIPGDMCIGETLRFGRGWIFCNLLCMCLYIQACACVVKVKTSCRS